MEIGAKDNKVVALWDVVCQSCMKHAFTTELMLSGLQCQKWCKRLMRKVYIDRTVLFGSRDRLRCRSICSFGHGKAEREMPGPTVILFEESQ